MTIRTWIEQQQGKERRYLTWFSIGATLFFAGTGIMLFADQRLIPSLTQELVVLAGLCLAIAGALTAACGYLMLTLLRVFYRRTNND